jgi:GAF domain-containing protein
LRFPALISHIMDPEFSKYALFFRLRNGKYHFAGSNNAEASYVKYLSEHPISPGRGSLIGRTAVERRTVHIPDCLADSEYTLHEYAHVGKHRSMLGVPLLRNGVAVGVIGLLRTSVEPFLDAKDHERLNSGVQSVLINRYDLGHSEMMPPAIPGSAGRLRSGP